MRPLVRTPQKVRAAVAMRLSGAPIDAIAETCGFDSPRDAQRAIEKSLAGLVEVEDLKAARALYVSRLDALLIAVWDQAVDQENPEQISYVKTALAIEERRAKLTGADAAIRHEVYSPTAEQIEAHVKAYANSHPGVILEAEIVEEIPAESFDAGNEQPALPLELTRASEG